MIAQIGAPGLQSSPSLRQNPPVKIVIDVREAFRPRVTGKGRWTLGFLRELAGRDVEILAVSDESVDAGVPLTVIDGKGLRWHRAVARWLSTERPGDLYVSPTSYVVPFLLRGRFPCAPVVHDLIAFRGEPHDRRATLIERFTLGRSARSAAAVFTVSESTRRDLLARYPRLEGGRVRTIYAGPMDPQPAGNRSDGRTILCVGTLSPRKNQERLLRAYASLPADLRERYRLVLGGGRGWHDAPVVALAGAVPGASWIGYVDDAAYEELLGTCAVFALPSLYEGFGLQVLDALQRGVPVLTSDRGSLSEVAGDAAVTVDPERVSSIAAGLQRLLTDDALAADLRRRGPVQASAFSWKRTVDLFLETVQKM